MSPKALIRSYQDMEKELEQLLEWFEGNDINLDDALVKYEQAMKLLQFMETHLKTAQNNVKKISIKFDEI
jgi:exodeoxyribonuclease VII small subunit